MKLKYKFTGVKTMFGFSHHQNNQLVSKVVSLPKSYLNYLSWKSFGIHKNLADTDIIFTENHHLFPGIKIIEVPDQENVKVSINERTLPLNSKSLRSQTVILNALQTLDLISKVSADAILPRAQKQMSMRIHHALKKCLVLDECSEDSFTSTKLIVFLSMMAVGSLIGALVVTAGSVFLFSPMAMPIMLAVAVTAIIYGSLMGAFWGCFTGSMRGLIISISDSRQAKTACEELSAAVKEVKDQISCLSPNVSSVEQGSTSTAANIDNSLPAVSGVEKEGSSTAAANDEASSSKEALDSNRSRTPSPNRILPEALPANNPEQANPEENTATTATAYKP